MHMMRRLKSIASGRSSVSDPGGDSGSKRPKFEQDGAGDIVIEPHLIDDKPMRLDQESSSSSNRDAEASTSTSMKPVKTEEPGTDLLPKEMNDMTISDDKADVHNDKESEGVTLDGNGTETGQIIVTTIGGHNGKPKQKVSYMAERVVGTGSFGVVFQAKCLETGETVAIKKVLQDKRYKNRELQTMQLLDHPNVVQLKHHFFSTTQRGEVYLNLVLEFVSETVYRVAKYYNRMNQRVPIIYVKLYAYQMCRALAYIHRVVGVCHRDIKPQNLLVNPHTHQLKICDFGSAKKLVPGEPNISYICSRYYRAPELIFGATEYTTAIDIWSVGCVVAELMVGQLLISKGASRLTLNCNGWPPIDVARIFGRRSLKPLLSPNSHSTVPVFQPSSYLALPLMSILSIAREFGLQYTVPSVDDSDLCSVCLERSCSVAAEGCSHEFCIKCALYLCSTSNIRVEFTGPPGSIPCPLCRNGITSFNKLPSTPMEGLKSSSALTFCNPCILNTRSMDSPASVSKAEIRRNRVAAVSSELVCPITCSPFPSSALPTCRCSDDDPCGATEAQDGSEVQSPRPSHSASMELDKRGEDLDRTSCSGMFWSRRSCHREQQCDAEINV